jgi:LysR family transcriptional regulator, positive regulator for ilvC
MDLHELRQFLTLANTLHFGKTSRMCHISTPALSRMIQRLEAEVGHRLFIRDNRSVQLSDVGRRFRHFAQDTVDRWEALLDSLVAEDTQLRGELLLYASVTAAGSVLTDLFARFRDQFPKVHIRLETGDAANAIERVQDGSADVTVAARPEKLPKNLHFKLLTSTPLILIAPTVPCDVTALVSQPEIPWASVPMILAEQALSRKRAEAWFRRIGVKPNIYAEVAGHEAIIAMVRLGCGVGIVPEIVYRTSTFRDEIQVLPVEANLTPYEVGLCVHGRRLTSPVVRAFWEIADVAGGAERV